jgi:DNA-directed RNA polymerase subunit RPC12/RpoP
MTNKEYLAERIQKLSAEEVYDLLYDIFINIGSRYNSSRAGIAQWLTEESNAAQVRHGRWIKLYAGNYKCSECGDWWRNDDNEMIKDFSYCPNCGSRMDLDEVTEENE